MAKVTYFLGAGASFNALPLVNQIPNELENFKNELSQLMISKERKFGNINSHTILDGKDLMVEACTKLIDKVRTHASIDTYAKKLSVTFKRQELRELKTILSCLFIFIQYVRKVDYRYDAFLASTLGKDLNDFNNDIRIVSWNYDFQIERAFSEFSMQSDLKLNQKLLNIFPDGLKLDAYTDRFSVFKVNGTTAFHNKVQGSANEHLVKTFDLIDRNDLLEKCIWYFIASAVRDDIADPTLSFAWESQNNEVVDAACKATMGSKAIVIIGYSFPYFNREIDRKLLATMTAFSEIRIYVQDKDPSSIIKRLSSVLPANRQKFVFPIETYITGDKETTKDQFFLPPEL